MCVICTHTPLRLTGGKGRERERERERETETDRQRERERERERETERQRDRETERERERERDERGTSLQHSHFMCGDVYYLIQTQPLLSLMTGVFLLSTS